MEYYTALLVLFRGTFYTVRPKLRTRADVQSLIDKNWASADSICICHNGREADVMPLYRNFLNKRRKPYKLPARWSVM